MELYKLGFRKELEQYCLEEELGLQNVGRVISEHKERYTVQAESGIYDSVVTGRLVYDADDRSDFPATGDWVELQIHDEDIASIISILPRDSVLERRAAGKISEKQIIATNIDYGLIVQAIDKDFSVNRIERYLTICSSSNIKPIVILSKSDLTDMDFLRSIIEKVEVRTGSIPVVPISSTLKSGYDVLKPLIMAGQTYCLLGSSGAGKSTLLNNLAGEDLMDTGAIGETTNRGRHVTTHRELVVLQDGGIIIDNPGMRELGIADAAEGLKATFNEIAKLSKKCRFNDCSHAKDKGCAVLRAIKKGDIDNSLYENYKRMQREVEHYQSSDAERRQKSKKLASTIKNAKNNKRAR
jgi:ribosome biogenesis GTPase